MYFLKTLPNIARHNTTSLFAKVDKGERVKQVKNRHFSVALLHEIVAAIYR